MDLKKILAFVIMAAVCAGTFDADAKRRRKKTRKKPRTTRVVMKTPTASGPLSETEPFVVFDRPMPITKGLDNRVIALWQSHGKYYDQSQQRWKWQRPRLFGTVEDLFSQGYVMPYLMPMLENAGAYVMSPRERDTSLTEIIVDTDGYPEGDFYLKQGKHQWKEGNVGSGFAYSGGQLTEGRNPFVAGTSETVSTVSARQASEQSNAAWNADIPARGRYAVYVSYASHPNSATDAHYKINHLGGTTDVKVNQQMGGGTWLYLGHYDFAKGKQQLPIVELSNISDDDDAVVSADAVKIGGGMGNVARSPKNDPDLMPVTSDSPRFTEGARYWLQWAGMPRKVYSESNGEDDYTDDYKSRALWVNYLAGGSPMLPDSVGLKIPVDMALAFHTDAGTTEDGSVVGTLGIYSTDSGNLLGDGRSRVDCRSLTEAVTDQVATDLRALHDPMWTLRGNRDRKYYEIRETKVPAMIIELLSHQNFDDMKYGLDPAFRFDVSRAVYKGILRFLSRRYNTPYVVQPLPVGHFSIKAQGGGRYNLSWRQTTDPLEKTAYPKYYVVEERIDNGAFRAVATVAEPRYEVTVTDSRIHSYRIVAGNDGGTSFPSEVLALYNDGSGVPKANIVNGFTRISAPDTFFAGEFSGFDYMTDSGVADVADIITTGRQYDYSPSSEFLNNDVPGYGASHGNMEKAVTAGNTHDFVYLHGRALKSAGLGFVSSGVDAYSEEVVLSSAGTPENPPVTDLILGKQKEIMPGNGSRGTKFKAFPTLLQRRLEAYCSQGGSLMISGAYIATDLMDNRFADAATRDNDHKFATSLLGYDWQLGKGSIDGKVSSVPSPFKPFGVQEHLTFEVTPTPDSYAVESPDAIRPSGIDAATIMRYDENGLSAAVALERAFENGGSLVSYRVVSMGFPFETIKGESQRNRLMKDIMTFLTGNKNGGRR